MNEARSISEATMSRSQIVQAIGHAARKTGARFDFLLAKARLESDLDPEAQARTSNAAGLFQFIPSTWQALTQRYGNQHGLTSNLHARFDPHASAVMAGELSKENSQSLAVHLGRQPNDTELYLAHFLGAGGARKFLDALANSPETAGTDLLPTAASANPAVFTDGGRPRSVADIFDFLNSKMANAKAATRHLAQYQAVSPEFYPSHDVPTNKDYGAASPYSSYTPSIDHSRTVETSPPRASGASMAATIRSTFAGLPASERGAEAIERAYRQFEAFEL